MTPLHLPAEAYHADTHCPEPSLSSTMAKTFLAHHPRKVWLDSRRMNPNWRPKETEAFDIGHAAHGVILGRGGDYVEIPPETLASNGAASTKAAKEFIEEARAAGRVPLKGDVIEGIMTMADAVTAHLRAMGIVLDPARSELAAFAQVEGVWNRAMIDNAPADPRLPLFDLKTTAGSVNPDELARVVAKMGYDIQIRHYLDVWKAATGEDRTMRLIFVQKPGADPNPSYDVGVIELYNDGTMRPASDYASDEPLTADWFADAAQKLTRVRRTFRQCLDRNEWPGYPARTSLVGAPIWHRRQSAVDAGYEPIRPAAPPEEALRAAYDAMKPEGME